MTVPVLRVGLVLAKDGHERRVIQFDQRPPPCRWRIVWYVANGTTAPAMWDFVDVFEAWSTRATVVAEGTGEVAPWL